MGIPKSNQGQLGTKSSWMFVSKLSNPLPQQIKSAENLIILKIIMKQWNETQWKCMLCENKPHHLMF